MEDNKFRVINEKGEEIICDILFTFDSEDTKKSYIVYTDNTKDQFGNIQVFASIYDKNEKTPKLQPIETEQEWKIVETILNSLQENIQKKMNEQNLDDNIDELIDDVYEDIKKAEKEDLDFMFDDIEDDFGILDPVIEQDLGFIQPIVLKLHFYEKHSFNHSSHMPHTKIGEVLIDGTCGTITIGNSRISDICIPNTVDLKPLHIMLVIANGKVLITDLISSLTKSTINDQEFSSGYNESASFYELNNGNYFTISHKYKVYVEIVDPSNSKIMNCLLCGNKFIQTIKDNEYCVDCRKQLEEEMAIEIKHELNKININNLDAQTEDLDIKIINIDENHPKILEKIFKR